MNINTLWLGVYPRYTPWHMLDITTVKPFEIWLQWIELQYSYIAIYKIYNNIILINNNNTRMFSSTCTVTCMLTNNVQQVK